ncbi:MAG: type II secretion system F family protein, partial [Actinomycetota bacterium]
MTTLIAALAALGLLLVYDGLTGSEVRRRTPLTASLDRLTQEAGLPGLGGYRCPGLMVALSALTLLVVAGLTSSFVVATVIAATAGWAPLGYLRARRARRRRLLREAWPDALAGLVSGVRAGISLAEACSSLESRAPEDLRPGFATFATTYRMTGSFQSALDRLDEQLADPVADRVIVSLRTAHEVGGTDLVRVLRTLSDFVREDLRVRKEIEARW